MECGTFTDVICYKEENDKIYVYEKMDVKESDDMLNKIKVNGKILVVKEDLLDYEYEEKMALINEEISGLDTIYIRAGEFGNVSSSMVIELLEYGRDVSKFLPPEVLELVKNYNKIN